VEAELGERRARAAVSQLSKRGLVSKSYELASARVKPKTETHLCLAGTKEEIEEARGGRSKKLAAVVELLEQQGKPTPWQWVRKSAGCNKAILDALVARGLVSVTEVAVTRDPLAGRSISGAYPWT